MNLFGVDLADIGQTVSVARNAGGLIQEALGGVQKITKLVSGSKEPGADTGLQLAFVDLLTKLIEVQTAHADLLDRLQRTEAALKAAQARHDESLRYQLTELSMGGFVLALKETEAKGEPFHYLCQSCSEDGKKRVLQPFGHSRTTLECPDCKQMFRTADEGSGIRFGRRRDPDGFSDL